MNAKTQFKLGCCVWYECSEEQPRLTRARWKQLGRRVNYAKVRSLSKCCGEQIQVTGTCCLFLVSLLSLFLSFTFSEPHSPSHPFFHFEAHIAAAQAISSCQFPTLIPLSTCLALFFLTQPQRPHLLGLRYRPQYPKRLQLQYIVSLLGPFPLHLKNHRLPLLRPIGRKPMLPESLSSLFSTPSPW